MEGREGGGKETGGGEGASTLEYATIPARRQRYNSPRGVGALQVHTIRHCLFRYCCCFISRSSPVLIQRDHSCKPCQHTAEDE